MSDVYFSLVNEVCVCCYITCSSSYVHVLVPIILPLSVRRKLMQDSLFSRRTLWNIPNPTEHPEPYRTSLTLQNIPNPKEHPEPYRISLTLQNIPNPTEHPEAYRTSRTSRTLQNIHNPTEHPEPYRTSRTLQNIPNPTEHPEPCMGQHGTESAYL